MNRNFFTFALASVLSCGLGVMAAQDAPPPPDSQNAAPGQARKGMDPDQQIVRMQKFLNLTEDQTNQIKPIITDRQQQMMALRDDTSMQRSDKMAKMRNIVQESDSKIIAILNDDQKAKYSQMEQQMRDRMRQRTMDRQPNQGTAEQPNQ